MSTTAPKLTPIEQPLTSTLKRGIYCDLDHESQRVLSTLDILANGSPMINGRLVAWSFTIRRAAEVAELDETRLCSIIMRLRERKLLEAVVIYNGEETCLIVGPWQTRALLQSAIVPIAMGARSGAVPA